MGNCEQCSITLSQESDDIQVNPSRNANFVLASLQKSLGYISRYSSPIILAIYIMVKNWLARSCGSLLSMLSFVQSKDSFENFQVSLPSLFFPDCEEESIWVLFADLDSSFWDWLLSILSLGFFLEEPPLECAEWLVDPCLPVLPCDDDPALDSKGSQQLVNGNELQLFEYNNWPVWFWKIIKPFII